MNQDTYFIVEKEFNGNDQALGLVDARSLFPQTYTNWKIPTTYTVSILSLCDKILANFRRFGHFWLIRGIQNPRDSHEILIDVILNPKLIYGSRDYSLISHIWPWNELE